MAGLALSTMGVKFGWALGTLEKAPTEKWEQIEECISIGGVELSQDKLDATPLESHTKKYIAGHEDTGGELQTVFNNSNTFDEQWEKMTKAYESKSENQVMYFCAYHPSKKNMNIYIVEPGELPAPEFAVGNVLQYSINNTLVDLPKPIPKVEPKVNAGASQVLSR